MVKILGWCIALGSLGLLVACAGLLVPFTLSLEPASLSVGQGKSGTATVKIRVDGAYPFGEKAALSLPVAPTGVTASFDPPEISPSLASGAGESVMTLRVAVGVAAGNHQITLQGSLPPQVTNDPRTAATFLLPFTLTVNPPDGNAPDFSLPIPATPLSLPLRSSLNVTVPIQRVGGFSGAVELTLGGEAQGLEYGFNPLSATGSSSVLNLNALPTAQLGSRGLIVQGKATINNQTVIRTANLFITIVSGGQ